MRRSGVEEDRGTEERKISLTFLKESAILVMRTCTSSVTTTCVSLPWIGSGKTCGQKRIRFECQDDRGREGGEEALTSVTIIPPGVVESTRPTMSPMISIGILFGPFIPLSTPSIA